MRFQTLLDQGVAAGIITPAQAEALAALGESSGSTAAADAAAARDLRVTTGTGVEALRGFNAIAVAYGLGAIVVLFAFGWFMVDRWNVLGGGGVLALSLGYAALFLVVAQTLKREGFPFARGVATLLAVAMAPIAMWGLLRFTGLWTPALDQVCAASEHPFVMCQGQPIAIEFAVVAAALLAMRQLNFSPLMIPIAVVAVTLPERLLHESLATGQYNPAQSGWRWVIIASVLAAVAYVMDRRRRGEDYAFWLWLSVAFATFIGVATLFQGDPTLRWALGPLALLMLATAVLLRRRVLLVLGVFGVFGFLAWLAFDVFKLTTAFPLVLALIGVSVLVLTVLVQKRYPGLIAGGGDHTQAPRFPGGAVSLLTPALLGVLLLPNAARVDQDLRATMRSRSHARASRVRAHRDSVDAKSGRERRRETPRPPVR